jgi:hypothetical protein
VALLFTSASCHGVFVSQTDASSDSFHLRHRLVFDGVADALDISHTYLQINDQSPCALDVALSHLSSDIFENHRRVLLVGGSFLDESVSSIALHALAKGFDVHLQKDLCLSRDSKLTRMVDYRLLQAGAVLTSLKQLIVQWRAVEGPSGQLAKLSNLIMRYDSSLIAQGSEDRF